MLRGDWSLDASEIPLRGTDVPHFVRGHIYHWGPAREQPDRGSYDYGVVYDPVKLVNVYGYGYCFQNRAAAEALWEAAGLAGMPGLPPP